MADTFEKILVKDDKIGCLTNRVKYQVLKGGQNITSQPFNAISQSISAHVYNITVPSLETIISREVLWQSTVTLKINLAVPNNVTATLGKPGGQFLVNYGVTDALAPFPLHSLVTNMTCTINNNTVSMNVQDTLPVLLRLLDAEELAKYECMTPTTLDFLANYRDGIDLLEYQIDTATNANAQNLRPVVYTVGTDGNEPAVVDNAFTSTRPQAYHSYANNTLAYDMNRPAGSTWYHKPRGSYKIEAIWAGTADRGTSRVPLASDTEVYVRFTVTEPLLLSPFVFGDPDGKQGFYGIQTMNFQMNIAPTANRAWRSVGYLGGAQPYTKTASVVKFENSRLIFNFLTPHASDMLEPRNVVPYYELPIYRSTTGLQDLAARTQQIDATGLFIEPPGLTIFSSNIQLNCVPDKLIIFVRKTVGNLQCHDTDSYLTIKKCVVQWNNQAGLLSSHTPEQLYRASVHSGLNNLTWDEFSGTTVTVGNYRGTGAGAEPRAPYTGVGAISTLDASRIANGGMPGIQLTPTTGSILVLNFADVIQLTEEYYAPGSLGSFNLQVQLDVQNNHSTIWQSKDYEMVIMPMNTGVFVNEKGTSSTFIALLTKEDVIQASSQEPYTYHEVKRMVGGSFLSGLKSSLGWLSSKLPFVKNALGSINHPYAQTGANVLNALGYGKGKLADRLM